MGCPVRRLAAPVLVSAGLIASLGGCSSPERAAGVPTHYVSHQLCSAAFVGGLDPDAFYKEAVQPVISPADLLIRYNVDLGRKEVEASLAGLVRSRAVFRGALGCQVDHGIRQPEVIATKSPLAPPLLPPIAGKEAVEPNDPALKATLDRAFAEPEGPRRRYTKAVVIVHDGRIIAERYAPGIGVDTPHMGWSMTKSVTNALIGILVRDGRVAVDAPAPIPAWSDPSDPRHGITIDNLLRMTSGLDFGQSLYDDWTDLFNPPSWMNFDVADQSAFAEQADMVAPPGTRWTYTNGNTLLLSRIIRDLAGGDAAHVYRFAHRELFDRIGMEHVTLEFDSAGTPIGSSHMWASARDWARFGLLYLNGGVIAGERILPAGWVDYAARFTPGSDDFGYGAGFWTNRGTSTGALGRVKAGMPADSFMARGSFGQYVVIVPSARLVIVRLGNAHTPLGDIDAMERLVADAVAATKDM
jgi:CubicO group peptidase (beta-lactamase class C family)